MARTAKKTAKRTRKKTAKKRGAAQQRKPPVERRPDIALEVEMAGSHADDQQLDHVGRQTSPPGAGQNERQSTTSSRV